MSYENLEPRASHQRLGEGWTYLDVRTVEEYAGGHVPGAYNIPYATRGPLGMQPNPEFVAVVQRHFPADAKLVLGCAGGVRSARACELLAEAGFQHLVSMDGGFQGSPDGSVAGWCACDLPVEAAPEAGRTYDALSG